MGGDFAVAQIPDIRSTVRPFRGPSGFPLGFRLIGALVLLLLSTSWVQAQSAPTPNSGRNKAITSAASPAPSEEVAPSPVVPPPLPTVEQKPPQPPVVAWDGQQLTIDADNSTLAAVLLAIRDRTGASIEIPGAASGERVFVHLGPGPARDVISSLLYGTPFDYVVETGDDDPDTLRRVVLTGRGLDDSSGNVVVAGATNTGEGSLAGSSLAAPNHRSGAPDGRSRSEGARMMPGWASSGKPAFQAEAEAALAAEQAAAQDSAAVQDSDAIQDPVAAKDPAATQDSAVAKDSPVQEPIAAQDPAVAQSSVASADAVDVTRVSNSSPSTSDSDGSSGVGQAIQNMTKMFEQRRQIQAQQKQPPPPSSN